MGICNKIGEKIIITLNPNKKLEEIGVCSYFLKKKPLIKISQDLIITNECSSG